MAETPGSRGLYGFDARVVQSVAPESRVVYVNNDPLVLSQAKTS